MNVYIKLTYKKIHAHFPSTQKGDENDQTDKLIEKQSTIRLFKGNFSAGCNNGKKHKYNYSFFFPQCWTIN